MSSDRRGESKVTFRTRISCWRRVRFSAPCGNRSFHDHLSDRSFGDTSPREWRYRNARRRRLRVLASLIAFLLMISTWLYSRIKVGTEDVTVYRFYRRRIKLSELAGVTLEIAHTGMNQRSVLCFHFVDGRRYLYRNFNGSPKPGDETWANVDNARSLIERRIAEANRVEGTLSALAPKKVRDVGQTG